MRGRLQRGLAIAAVFAGLGTFAAASNGLAQADAELTAATHAPKIDCPDHHRPKT